MSKILLKGEMSKHINEKRIVAQWDEPNTNLRGRKTS